MKLKPILVAVASLVVLAIGSRYLPAKDKGDASKGLKDTTVLIIRHGEEPSSGPGLGPVGQKRAQAYVGYFQNLTLDSVPTRPDYLIAAADSPQSHRPRLTLEPLSNALKLPIHDKLTFKENEQLAKELGDKRHGKVILICWHHSFIPDLLKALGADAKDLLPDGKWPDNVYSFVLRLPHDDKGALIPAGIQRIETNFRLE